MKLVRQYLDGIQKKLEDEFDRVIIVLGDEGHGKSTFMMQTGWFWQDSPTVESTIDCVAWDYNDFKMAMASRDAHSLIMVHDAARVLSRKKAMRPETVEIEEDLFDVRQGQYVIMLGFQDWEWVPTMLANRRAKNVFRIPTRGRVHCYNRKQMDKRQDTGSWPDAAFIDTFADLSSTELWETFKREDLRRKRERIAPEDVEEEEEMSIDELVTHIQSNGIEDVISYHRDMDRYYFDWQLIKHDFDLTKPDAKLVKKLLERNVEPREVVEG